LAEKFVSSTFTNEGSKSSDILFSCPYTTSGFILLNPFFIVHDLQLNFASSEEQQNKTELTMVLV